LDQGTTAWLNLCEVQSTTVSPMSTRGHQYTNNCAAPKASQVRRARTRACRRSGANAAGSVAHHPLKSILNWSPIGRRQGRAGLDCRCRCKDRLHRPRYRYYSWDVGLYYKYYFGFFGSESGWLHRLNSDRVDSVYDAVWTGEAQVTWPMQIFGRIPFHRRKRTQCA
jgi:hypothetical protein